MSTRLLNYFPQVTEQPVTHVWDHLQRGNSDQSKLPTSRPHAIFSFPQHRLTNQLLHFYYIPKSSVFDGQSAEVGIWACPWHRGHPTRARAALCTTRFPAPTLHRLTFQPSSLFFSLVINQISHEPQSLDLTVRHPFTCNPVRD